MWKKWTLFIKLLCEKTCKRILFVTKKIREKDIQFRREFRKSKRISSFIKLIIINIMINLMVLFKKLIKSYLNYICLFIPNQKCTTLYIQ